MFSSSPPWSDKELSIEINVVDGRWVLFVPFPCIFPGTSSDQRLEHLTPSPWTRIVTMLKYSCKIPRSPADRLRSVDELVPVQREGDWINDTIYFKLCIYYLSHGVLFMILQPLFVLYDNWMNIIVCVEHTDQLFWCPCHIIWRDHERSSPET